MKSIIKKGFISLAIALVSAFSLVPFAPVSADSINFESGKGATGADGMASVTLEPTKLVTTAVNYLMFAIAVISVVMIIIGGIRYATSGGSSDKVKSAKNTILYAVIGLAVALLALAIVNLVVNKVGEI